MMARLAKILSVLTALVAVTGISAYLTLVLIVKSEETVVVPDLVGREVVYALEILSDLELNIRVKDSEYSAEIAANHVVYQSPAAGSEIKKGREVRIVVSKGPQSVVMPNLHDIPERQAQIIIEENDLCSGTRTQVSSAEVNRERVLAQTPVAGLVVARKTCVNLLLSSGRPPRAFMMPRLTGLPFSEAILALEAAGLDLGDVTTSFDPNRPRGVVLSQEPLSGHRVEAGMPTRLTLNRPAGTQDDRTLESAGGVGIFCHRFSDGFLKRQVQVRLNCFGLSIDLIQDYVRAGEQICVLVPRNNNATVLLYQDGELIATQLFE